MTRYLSIPLLLVFSSCKEENEPLPESPANQSVQRMEAQEEDLAIFMADFDEAMNAKYTGSGIVPTLKNTDLFKIEGTKAFNYNFHLTLHQKDQLEPVKKELHRLMNIHGVETINFLVIPKFEVTRSDRDHYLGSWRLAKDGTESQRSNMTNRKDQQGLLDRLRQRAK